MTNKLNSAINFAHENENRFRDELIELVRIPSVSTDVEHKGDMQKAAEYLANKLKGIGMNNVSIMPTGLRRFSYRWR